MRLIIQRVLEAGVKVNGEFISKIGPGMCILLGLHKGDNNELVDKWAEKVLKLKLWPAKEEKTEEKEEEKSSSSEGKGGWKTGVLDNNFDVLVVSNFTLYGILKGNKPDFHSSMNADEAKALYERFLQKVQSHHKVEKVQGGKFQTYMNVHIVNDGPVTLCIDADEASDVKQNQQKQKQQQQSQSQPQQQQQQQQKPKKSLENIPSNDAKEQKQKKHNNQQEKKPKKQGENQQSQQNQQKPEKAEKKQVIYEEKVETPVEKFEEKKEEKQQE